MDKQTFNKILECALLSFDGVSEQDIIEKHGLNHKLVKTGVKLSNYLKEKEIKNKDFLEEI
ncbi:MAG: hypothetical protein A3F40_04105 [Chlamydiae bacterium RIFCSPHIGHO2_12_FULL_27_8]|nr:MAG: hypothetical protein A3F40_04105 [Chlamydiae bacterium RIFCSPHIGHO2_12_FULL_27_8]